MGTSPRVSQGAAGALGLPLAIFVAAAIAATWPLVLSPAHHIAGGLGDPLLNTTILAWDADRVRHAFAGFWDAPFLFPNRHTLAYSEHLLGIAWFTTPIVWLSRNAVFAYNVAYIGSYALAGFGMFLLARSLAGRVDAAILAALAFELTPYRLAQTTHLQVLMNGWMPIGLWALHRYFATGGRRWLAGFTAAYAVLGLSNGYYFYFFALPVLIVAAAGLASARDRGRLFLELAASACLLAAIVVPIALVYYQLQRQHGFVRTDEDLGGLSARLVDYLHVSPGAWNWRGLLPIGGGERELFHGFVVLGFAALATIVVRTRTVLVYAAIALAATWMSLGTNGGPAYDWLFRHVPGFNGLRVPARFSSVAIVGLSVLASAGFSWVLDRLPRKAGLAWAAAIAGIILLEGQHGVGLSAVPQAEARNWERVAYDWLRASAPGAALELNITEQDDFHAFTTTYQLEAVRHHHPIVNGYSGWKSPLQEWLGGGESPLRDPQQLPDAIRGLRAIGVRYVLLHDDTFATPQDAAARAASIRTQQAQIAEEHRFGAIWAWRLADAEDGRARAGHYDELRAMRLRPDQVDVSVSHSRAAYLVDGDLETRWLSGGPQNGEEWIAIRLPQPTDVARVELVTAGRSLYDYPRHLVIDGTDAAGASRPLFEGSVVSQLMQALAIDEQFPHVMIDLPPNRSVVLRLRQTAQGDRWWSIHELMLWKR